MTNETEVDFDVALSFASEDRAFVELVAENLKQNQIRVFYDKDAEAYLWGKDLGDTLDEVYRLRSKYVVMFISEHYARKMWTNHERKSALARALQEKQEYVLPARFDDTELSGLRPTIAYIDLRKETPETFASKIIRKIVKTKPTPPLILRDGTVIKSIDELIHYAADHPNSIRGESRAISVWIETLGFTTGERLEIELKVQHAALGVKPNEVTSGMLPDILSGPIQEFTLYEGDVPPPMDMAKAGDMWINPVDRSEMLYVPSGEFVMGYPKDKLIKLLQLVRVPDDAIESFFDETPVRVVYLDGFWIDKLTITNAQFAVFLESERPSRDKDDIWRYEHIIEHAKTTGGAYPIHDVTWFEAMAYCKWAKKSLPTEAQWEKAARGNVDDRQLPWGNVFDLYRINIIEISYPFPDAVRAHENPLNVSPYGCIQMVGNVAEWCLDWYDPLYYSTSHNSDPTGPNESPVGAKVVRGGSTAKPVAYARTSARDHCRPEIKGDFIGFRCVWNYS